LLNYIRAGAGAPILDQYGVPTGKRRIDNPPESRFAGIGNSIMANQSSPSLIENPILRKDLQNAKSQPSLSLLPKYDPSRPNQPFVAQSLNLDPAKVFKDLRSEYLNDYYEKKLLGMKRSNPSILNPVAPATNIQQSFNPPTNPLINIQNLNPPPNVLSTVQSYNTLPFVAQAHDREEYELQQRAQNKLALQKIYQDQIAERERMRQEERQRKMLEDQKDEIRIQRDRGNIYNSYLDEIRRKKEEIRALAERAYRIEKKSRPQNKNLFEPSPENTLKPTLPEPIEEDPEPEDTMKTEENLILEIDGSKMRGDIPTDPEVEVAKTVSKVIKHTLTEEIGKLKKEVGNHAVALKDQLLTLKVLANVYC